MEAYKMSAKVLQTGRVQWQLLNPEAEYETLAQGTAARLGDLRGKTIGLFWNGKPDGDVLLDAIGKLFRERLKRVEIIRFNMSVCVGPDNVKKMVEKCDGIVAAVADCGSCTSWLIRDSIAIEKLGIPTAVIVTSHFAEMSRMVAESEGLFSLRILEVPHPIGGLSAEVIQEKARSIIDGVISGLTRYEEQEKAAESKVAIVRPEPETIKVSGISDTKALCAINELFYERRWTDGLPIVPPTEEAVEWMLTGTNRDPDEIIGLVSPRFGKATVRNIAINSVMAGAEPKYMPVIIAAVEAVTDSAFASGWTLTGMQATTSPASPLLIVSGPIANYLKIESGIDCFGRGHRANATIGRALRLILINTGGAYPGISDMKGQGSSQEFTFCVAEREGHPVFHRTQNRWKLLHIEKGYSRTKSTISAFAAFPPINVGDAHHCGPEILTGVVDAMTRLGQEPLPLGSEYVVVLGSTHAQCLADAGMSKDDIRDFLYANAVMPWSRYKLQYVGKQPSWMAHIVSDSTPIHIFESPSNINVIVAGGECPYSQVIKCLHNSVTKEIRVSKKIITR
jgi:hypothetical protein